MSKALVCKFDGRVCVAVHALDNPSALEWSGFVKDSRAAVEREDLRTLVISHGGSPDGAQRKQLTDELKGRARPTALLTGSRVVRGLLGALSWFNPRMRAMGLDDHEAACDFLGLSASERARALVLRRELEDELGITTATP